MFTGLLLKENCTEAIKLLIFYNKVKIQILFMLNAGPSGRAV